MGVLALSTLLAVGACNKQPETADNAVPAVPNGSAANTVAATGAVDSDFVTSSIKGDTAEVAIGQLAASKGSTQAVKDFGSMLVADHGAHKQKLIALADSAGIAVPQEPAEEGHANLLKLEKLQGAEFDRTFAQMLVDSHHKGIAKNEEQAQSSDAQTAQLAKETLPVLKKHLAGAEALLR
jgi:putative membrane protein